MHNQLFCQFNSLLHLPLQAVVWEHEIWQLKCYWSLSDTWHNNSILPPTWTPIQIIFFSVLVKETTKLSGQWHLWDLSATKNVKDNVHNISHARNNWSDKNYSPSSYGVYNFSKLRFGLCSLSHSFSVSLYLILCQIKILNDRILAISWPVTVNIFLRIL